ncbi:hypothetical protein B0T10DRAFT_485380 [Thelonectria olida]|uniref:Zn(2)-C6 fungal-type domain-containing protein n=1 Tax=Thelonectria olida TaxID=1576542 RepID=A0A9P8W995_9HYPO|nr:hypothetical protein B0T10DRAFT_485380 [Thelonectria olida]
MSDARMRRQNHSCDQCRKSKKACDGYLLNLDAFDRQSAAYEREYTQSGLLPCSYCVKTKKLCPLNSHWGRPEATARASQSSATATSSNGSSHSKRRRTEDQHHAASSPSFGVPRGLDLSANILHLLQTPSPSHESFAWDNPIPSLESHVNPTRAHVVDPFCGGIDDTNSSSDASGELDNLGLHLGDDHVHQASVSDLQSNAYSGSGPSELDFQTPLWDLSQNGSSSRDLAISPRQAIQGVGNTQRNRRRRRESDNWQGEANESPALFDSDSLIMASSNNHLITESLLQIYHDVLENNLACWLSEETCPYKMERTKGGLQSMLLNVSSEATVPLEFTHSLPSAWPNRIYRRVLQLDRVAQAAGMIRLTRAESRAASRALDLVIMAFATQWAQGSRRHERYKPNTHDPLDPNQPEKDDLSNAFAEEFERNLQQSIWEQAKKALQDVSELESYRVIYAELIFGLTSRPWAYEDYSSKPRANPRSRGPSKSKGLKDSILSQIMDIISQEGPPVYMQRATQKIHALKYRFDANGAGFLESKYDEVDDDKKVSSGDRRTIGLLYWLAVMFDTVSSSMAERPVALADEECQHDGAHKDVSPMYATASKRQHEMQRWKLDLFVQDNPEKPTSSLRWPCPYDAAAKSVTKSAPVKILLFRHLSYLQNALRKREHGQPIEDIIQSVTRLVRYWNLTHGIFFRDLVKNYDAVPPRIRSWFICIAIPWHLGALMVADLIDFVDNNALGLEESTLKRIDSNMTTRIRKASAFDLSDIAAVTSPVVNDATGTPEQLPDFHFSLAEGPLLTEPWTMILIRGFSKAAVFHLSVADDLRQNEWAILGHSSEESEDSLRRAENCIRALWCLGKKSDMARNIITLLSQALQKQKA